jgi:hypothetical protein
MCVAMPFCTAVLESLVGPLPPLVSEELFEPIPDDLNEPGLFLETDMEDQGNTVLL